MKASENHFEVMESRTLLSSAVPALFVFTAQSFGSADALPLAPHVHHGNLAGADNGDWAGGGRVEHDGDFQVRMSFRAQHLEQYPTGLVWYGEFDDHGGWVGGYVGKVELSIPIFDNPPENTPQPQGSDETEGRTVTGKPSRVVNRPSNATPQAMAESVASRDSNPVTAASTVLLHNSSTGASTETFAQQAASVNSSPFARLATISVQGVTLSAKSNMIYLSFLDQSGDGESLLASLAARLRTAVVSFPAVALRETGVAVFANGGNVLSASMPRNFEFAHFSSPLMLMADSVGSFIQASAMIPFANSQMEPAHRAWMVTATVLGVDAILLGYYYQKRRKGQAALAMETALAR